MRRAIIAGALLLTASGAPAEDRSFGIWRNPQNSVHVRAEPCGDRMCGVVVWANDKAKADAARGGTKTLEGERLFRDFTRAGAGQWSGKVFVPDIGKTFSGTIRVIDATHAEGRGCLVGRVGCKAQMWTRVSD